MFGVDPVLPFRFLTFIIDRLQNPERSPPLGFYFAKIAQTEGDS
jgi:hypothetical protein